MTAVAGLGFHQRLSVCLFLYLHDISKTDAATITKVDVEMFYRESWKPIYFGVKRLKFKVRRHKSIAYVFLYYCERWLLLVPDVHFLL